MKKLFYILFFLFPVVVFAQQPWYKYSPLDYTWKNVGNAGFSAGEADYTSLAFSPSGGNLMWLMRIWQILVKQQ